MQRNLAGRNCIQSTTALFVSPAFVALGVMLGFEESRAHVQHQSWDDLLPSDGKHAKTTGQPNDNATPALDDVDLMTLEFA